MVQKSRLRVRYIVLLLSCFVMIGNYFCFDNPAALKSQLQTRFNQIPPQEFEVFFNMLYTIYSIPNIILPFFGGILVDRLGCRAMLILFGAIILLGQGIFALGCSMKSTTVMLVGRFVFGLGGESLSVAQSTLLVSWFQANELAFALGINLSIARLGSVFNNELSPQMAEKSGVSYAIWFGVIVCAFSVISALLVIPIDRKAEAMEMPKSIESQLASKSPSFSVQIRRFRPLFWMLSGSCLVVYGCVMPFNNVASSLLMERDFFKEPPAECQRCGVGMYANMTQCSEIAAGCPSSPPFSWPLPKLSQNCTIKTPRDQWNCSTSPPFLPDTKIDCEDLAWKKGPLTFRYCQKKADAEKSVATPMSVPYSVSAILSPFLGCFVDRVGLRAVLALMAPLVLSLVHILLGLTKINVWIPLLLQGIAYSVFAAVLWPSIPYVVDPEDVGLAYGLTTAIQNAGLALFPVLVALLYGINDRYIPNVEYLFAGFGLAGSLIGVAINIQDSKTGSRLNGQMRHRVAIETTEDDDQSSEALLDSISI